jgi:DNA processing protein
MEKEMAYLPQYYGDLAVQVYAPEYYYDSQSNNHNLYSQQIVAGKHQDLSACFFEKIKEVLVNLPVKLKRMPYPPLTLFLWGNTSLLNSRKIAIVGTRQPTEKAKQFAYESAKHFASSNYVVTSGGAEGIDTAAHEGALSVNGATISVLGNGFFHMYPPQNKPLFEKIRQHNGLLISEYLPNFGWNRFSFIQRNRITSGISDALLICASAEKGGSMIQTRIAFEQRIPLFCPALDLDIQPNEGIKTAIKDYQAQEIHIAEELLSKLNARNKTGQTMLTQEP